METPDNGINKDGTFRARRIGAQTFTLSQVYSALVTMSWTRFFLVILLAYLFLAFAFAIAYVTVDFENLHGLSSNTTVGKLSEVFFYSAQTMSTVGGAGIIPAGVQNNFILTLQSMMALLYMAIITGLLFVRFSRPTAKIAYSKNALISPYKEGKGLMIRIGNAKKIEVVELRAHLFFIVFDPSTNKRNFKELDLEQSHLPFSSTSWTIVHPITNKSPLFNWEEIQNLRFNIMLYIGAIDSVTGQSVNSRQSYSKSDILLNAKFLPCSELNADGEIMVYLDRISDYSSLEVL